MSRSRIALVTVAAGLAGCSLVNRIDPDALKKVCDRITDKQGIQRPDCSKDTCKSLPECQENTPEACTDGIDNDQDGYTDCADSKCFLFFECFPKTAFKHDADCPELLSASTLADDFTRPEHPGWEVGTPPFAPVFDNGRVNLAPTIGMPPQGQNIGALSTTATFQIGASRHFHLKAQMSFYDFANTRGGCEPYLRVAFVSPVTASPIAELGVAGTACITGAPSEPLIGPNGGMLVGCDYHNRGIITHLVTVGTNTSTYTMAFDAVVDPKDSSVVFFMDGKEVCRAGPLDPLEPESIAVFSGARAVASDPRIYLDSVELHLNAQIATPECKGLREPLLSVDRCEPAAYHIVPIARPLLLQRGRVYVGPDGHHMILPISGQLAHLFSPDGRTGWTDLARVEGLPDEPLGSQVDTNYMGGPIFNAAAGRFEVWRYEYAPATQTFGPGRMFVASLSAPTKWTMISDRLVLDVGGKLVDTVWIPNAVLTTDGGYIGWYTGFSTISTGGRPALFAAVSSDGVMWKGVQPSFSTGPVESDAYGAAAVFGAGPAGAWDEEGLAFGLSIQRLSDYFLMAYPAHSVDRRRAIGFAVSRDGVEWIRHESNPIIEGAANGFDQLGIDTPALSIESGTFRIWYSAFGDAMARHFSPGVCDTGTTAAPNTIRDTMGLTELELTHPKPAAAASP